MKVIMTGGGTGGHIYPAIAIAQKIQKENPDAEILFVGTERGLEKTLVPQNGYPIKFITVSGFNRKNLLKNFKTAKDLASGIAKAKEIIKEFQPDVVIGTGGYVCGPVVLVASRMGIPTYIHEQNAFPGVTNKLLEKYVKNVFIAFKEAEEYFKEKDKLIVTGNPVRESFFNADKKAARRELGIDEDDLVILSFGGSQGAGKINDNMLGLIEKLSDNDGVTIVYATGKYYYGTSRKKLEDRTSGIAKNVIVKEYIKDMDKFLAAADLVISRSGALTVSEITVCGRAAILIPSPNVTGNHQYFNAKAVADNGGAILIEEKDFNETILMDTVLDLVEHREKIEALEKGSLACSPGDAAAKIYDVIFGK